MCNQLVTLYCFFFVKFRIRKKIEKLKIKNKLKKKKNRKETNLLFLILTENIAKYSIY